MHFRASKVDSADFANAPHNISEEVSFISAWAAPELVFKSSWTQLEPTSGMPAKGGSRLTLTGNGFRADSKYSCFFRPDGSGAFDVRVTAFVHMRLRARFTDMDLVPMYQTLSENNTYITCEVPNIAPRRQAAIDLFEDGRKVQMLAPAVNDITLFSGWDSYFFNGSTNASFGDPASLNVFVSGYGFDSTKYYWCVFMNDFSSSPSPVKNKSNRYVKGEDT